MNDMNKPIFHNIPKPTITIEQFKSSMIDHLNSERFKELHRLIEYDMERIKGVCDAFLADCLERHPEMMDDVDNVVVEYNTDSVNILYRDEIVGIMKVGKTI